MLEEELCELSDLEPRAVVCVLVCEEWVVEEFACGFSTLLLDADLLGVEFELCV
jgi:hypothetical protein